MTTDKEMVERMRELANEARGHLLERPCNKTKCNIKLLRLIQLGSTEKAAIAAMGDSSGVRHDTKCRDSSGVLLLGESPASDSIGSPTRYTDGTVSREYEEQNIQTTPVSIHSAEDVNKPTEQPVGCASEEELIAHIAQRVSCLDNTVFRNTPANCKIFAIYAVEGMKNLRVPMRESSQPVDCREAFDLLVELVGKAKDGLFDTKESTENLCKEYVVKLRQAAWNARATTRESSQPDEWWYDVDWTNIGVSIDVSTGEQDAGRRAFADGPPREVMENKGANMLLFDGYLNDKPTMRESGDLSKTREALEALHNHMDTCYADEYPADIAFMVRMALKI